MRRCTQLWRMLPAVLPLLVAAGVNAGTPTVAECLEASDFITNAALSRDHGMPRGDFLARMDEDFLAIKAFPPQLRWFVQDEDDERFLLAQVRYVFDSPDFPENHRAGFLNACFARLTRS